MRGCQRCMLVLMAISLLVLPMRVAADKGSARGASLRQGDAVSLGNSFVRAVVALDGAVAIGTTGGDPDIPGDDNRRLLFGYPDPAKITGYPSLRLVAAGETHDRILTDVAPAYGPNQEGGAIVTRWLVDGVEVSQIISLMDNPYTNRQDLVLFSYAVRNTGATTLQAGIRCMLDLMVGGNDSAPLFIPGVGQLSVERQFDAAGMPGYFKAFESAQYAVDSLRAQGLLTDYGMTTPDRFVLATWARPLSGGEDQGIGIFGTAWDYPVTPDAKVGDAAVAYWWGPRELEPGASFEARTAYGLGGPGGGRVWLDSPVRIECADLEFDVTLWVSNTTPDVLTNGAATISVPSGLSLVGGQSETQSLGDVAPSEVASALWTLRASALQEEDLTIGGTVAFDNVEAPVQASVVVSVPECQGITQTPAPQETETPLPQETHTPSPQETPTPSPTPEVPVPEPGSVLLVGLGLSALVGLMRKRR